MKSFVFFQLLKVQTEKQFCKSELGKYFKLLNETFNSEKFEQIIYQICTLF